MTTTMGSNAMEARAVARYVRMTPMKVRRVVDLIRGLPAETAVDTLRFAPQAAALPVRKVLQSAMANAEQTLSADASSLVVARAYVDDGPSMKRWRPRAQGRPGPLLKRTCHVTVVVESVEADETPEGNSTGSKKKRRTR